MCFLMRRAALAGGQDKVVNGKGKVSCGTRALNVILLFNFSIYQIAFDKRSYMQKRYYVLDALRGVAAICVLFYHGMYRFGQRETWEFLQNAYLAVDFFFALSGFVIASSYQEKITNGSLSFGRFFVIRCIRFYPMIFASVAIAGPIYLYDLHCAQKITGTAFLDIIATALCLPTLYFVLAFPLNIPLWSLLCELCVNFAFVLAVPFFGRKEFVYTLGVSFMALLVLAYPDGISDLGWKSETITGGMVRALFSFLIGVAVYHVHQTIRLPETKAILLAPCVALAFMLVPNWNVFTGAYLYNFLCITAAFPALILVAANIWRPGNGSPRDLEICPIPYMRSIYRFLQFWPASNINWAWAFLFGLKASPSSP